MPGATGRAQVVQTGDGRTVMTLHVSGLDGLTRYGAHAHVHPCGATGAAAGPHFQWEVDPVVLADPKAGSTNPAYANPQNELWLDLTTNPAGEGRAKAVVDLPFPDERRPGSVIIHERHTSPADGTAGQRVGCLTLTW